MSGNRRLSRARWAAALLAAILALSLSAVWADAQDVPSYDDLSTLSEQPGPVGEAVPDTEYTPEYQGKDASKTWVQVEGARFSNTTAERGTAGRATGPAR